MMCNWWHGRGMHLFSYTGNEVHWVAGGAPLSSWVIR